MSLKIEGNNATLANLRNAPKVSSGGSAQAAEGRKTIGETPPTRVPLELLGELAELFAPGGLVSRLRRRLNRLKNKKCKTVPAQGTIACIDGDDVVYLGLQFLQEFKDQEEVIAGVMAHEWGHACAERPKDEEVQKLSWDEIFELRRAHETLADEISGRMLALLGYKPDGLINFLLRDEKEKGTHNLKYHAPKTRADVIRHGYQDELRKKDLANQIFKGSIYANNYNKRLIDDDI